MTKPKLLWVGHANIESGFARVTTNIIEYLKEKWDIAVLGIGYDGDPHDKPYRMYPAARAQEGGDRFGLSRITNIVERERPDVVAFVMEPWNIMPYVQNLRLGMQNAVKILGYCIVDGENMKREHANWLAQMDVTVFSTEFGLAQAVAADFNGRWYVIPHGVDPTIYKPTEKKRARKMVGLGSILGPDAFIFGNVNMNQPRKRLDLAVQSWAHWWHAAGKPDNAYLYLHADKKLDVGWDIADLARIFNVRGRVVAPAEDYTYTQETMRYVYNSLDVQFTTTAGEGWGLTTMEGMACGIPQIVPNFAALGEWCDPDVVRLVEANEISIMAHQQNVIRRTARPEDMAAAMDELYVSQDCRCGIAAAGRRHVLQQHYGWTYIAAGFDAALRDAMKSRGVANEVLVEKEVVGPSGTNAVCP